MPTRTSSAQRTSKAVELTSSVHPAVVTILPEEEKEVITSVLIRQLLLQHQLLLQDLLLLNPQRRRRLTASNVRALIASKSVIPSRRCRLLNARRLLYVTTYALCASTLITTLVTAARRSHVELVVAPFGIMRCSIRLQLARSSAPTYQCQPILKELLLASFSSSLTLQTGS